MTATTFGVNRSVGRIFDALRGEFRDAVTEIYLPCAVTVRIVALEAIGGMKRLIAQRKPQPVVKNKRGLA